MAYHETKKSWPTGGVLMVMPFDPDLPGPRAVGRNGRCQWRDDDHATARWSVVNRGAVWAVCDDDLIAFARAELAPPNKGPKDQPRPPRKVSKRSFGG